MNLVIDVGNTRAKIMAMDNGRITAKTYSDSASLSGLDAIAASHDFQRGIISVVGKLGQEAQKRLKSLDFPLRWLDSSTPMPFDLGYHLPGSTERIPLPSTMGADRIAAIVGAMRLCPGKPLLIVDAGTCVTYEVVGDDLCYLGGNIAPGLEMRMKSMHEHTALLPLFKAEGDFPEIGYDTETAMRCGARLGLQYEIEGYIRHYLALFPSLRVFLACSAEIALPADISSLVTHESNLVAYGLDAILEAL